MLELAWSIRHITVPGGDPGFSNHRTIYILGRVVVQHGCLTCKDKKSKVRLRLPERDFTG